MFPQEKRVPDYRFSQIVSEICDPCVCMCVLLRELLKHIPHVDIDVLTHSKVCPLSQ